MARLKGNIIFNSLNTITGILFPVITFPYASRVLMPEGIGTVNFLNSIVIYLILFTSMGIPLYAVREIAKYRNDKAKRDRITVELLIISSFLCLLGYLVVWILATYVPRINENAGLFYILSIAILFNSIGVNWFYQGIEDFKFITIRGVVVRCLAAASLFIFVRDSHDLKAYSFILVGTNVGNYLLNFIHLRKHVSLSSFSFRELEIIRHIKPTLQIFLLDVISSLYLQLNTVMLGFMSTDEEVGFFTAGTRISHIAISLITSTTAVMIPRASNLIKEGDLEGLKSILSKGIRVTGMFAYPMAVGLMVLAVPVTLVFCGNDFYPSIPVLLLNAPLILIISFTAIMAHQTLYPMEKVNLVIWSVAGGSFVNIIFNFILIPYFGARGAAFSTLLTEIAVFVILIFLGKKYFPFKPTAFFQPNYLAGSLIMGLCVYFTLLIPVAQGLKLVIGFATGFAVFLLFLNFVKDPAFEEVVKNPVKNIILKKLRLR